MKKKAPKCQFEGCKNPCRINRKGYRRYCHFHVDKVTIESFLSKSYSAMKNRTKGKSTNRPDLYKGKPIVSREVFYTWARHHPEFLRLYKMWINCDFDQRFTPSVNRLTSKRGYTLDNMEWVTNSQNCKLAHAVGDLNRKKEIYKLLGVNR